MSDKLACFLRFERRNGCIRDIHSKSRWGKEGGGGKSAT